MAGGDSKLKKSSSVGAVNTNPESQTMSEPKMIKKFGVMKGEGDNSNNPEFAHMSHFSDISKLRAQAPAGDERLNDYNLERIHRFVDQPLEKLGDERKLLREGMKNLGSTVREVVSPFVNEEAPNFVLDKKFGQKIAPKAKVNHTVQMTKPDGTVETLSYDISAKATHSDLSMRKASLVKYKKVSVTPPSSAFHLPSSTAHHFSYQKQTPTPPRRTSPKNTTQALGRFLDTVMETDLSGIVG